MPISKNKAIAIRVIFDVFIFSPIENQGRKSSFPLPNKYHSICVQAGRNSVPGYRYGISYAIVAFSSLSSINAVIELFPFLAVDQCESGIPFLDTMRYIQKSAMVYAHRLHLRRADTGACKNVIILALIY
jgi:hypothetical protein